VTRSWGVQQRLPSLIDPPISFAHRGARAHSPENTIPAFELALRLGARGLETDAWLTADGEVVLDHDGMVGRRFRKREIREMQRDELPPHIPTLAELIDSCGSDFDLSIDLKDQRVAGPIANVIASLAPHMAPRVYLCHPQMDFLVQIKAEVEPMRLIHSTRLERLTSTPEMQAARLAEVGIHGINMHHTDWNGGLVALFHRFGLLAFSWDLQFEHQLRPALRMGIDAVFCDDPDVMVDAFAAEIGQP
jgi:glycerophosphoryl diester phosphodiesterase